jgi:hypothetical protein
MAEGRRKSGLMLGRGGPLEQTGRNLRIPGFFM